MTYLPNREIKFRAWNKDENQMYLSPSSFDGLHHLGSWFEAHSIFGYGKISESVIMQYTGLKDKNGKEIYEGDIVRGGHFNGSYADGEVVFWTGGWWVNPIPDIEGFYELYNNLLYVEVIGNIFQP